MKQIAALSANALLAKARAMHGDILTPADYHEMISCRSVNELANYLKTHTAYASVFRELPSVRIHRARLEAALRRYTLSRTASLASLEKALGGSLYKILLLQYDMNLLVTCAEYLDSDTIGEFFMFAPEFYKKNSALPLLPMERARSFEELYAALSETPYRRLLDVFQNGSIPFDVQALENLAQEFFFMQSEQIIRDGFAAETQKELLKHLRTDADLTTIEGLYRLKTFFPQADPTRAGLSLRTATAFSPKEREALTAATTPAELTAHLQHSAYGRILDFSAPDIIERKTRKARMEIYEKQLRFSTHPQITMLSFIGILQNERTNLTHIAEGIRYGLAPEEIAAFLVQEKGAEAVLA